VFLEPSAPREKIDDMYFEELKKSKFNLTEWTQKLSIISKIDTKASIEKVQIEEFYIKRAVDHHTPYQTSAAKAAALKYIELTPYKRQISDVNGLGLELISNPSMVAGLLKPIDDGLFETSNNLLKLIGMHEESAVELSAVVTKVDTVMSTIGNRLPAIKEEFQAPTVWGTVAVLATNINKISDVCNSMEPTLVTMRKDIDKLLLAESQNLLAMSDSTSLSSRFDHLRDTVYLGFERIASNTRRSTQDVDNIYMELNNLRNVRSRFVPETSTVGSMVNVDELKAELDRVTRVNDELAVKLRNLAAQSDKEAIKFCNLGFRTFQEASAWIDIHFPDYSFGLIMSVFTVLEHVYAIFAGTPSLERLNHLYKLKIDCLNKGAAITSFDSRWPKYFMKTQSVSPITTDQSFFDRIPTYDVWDEAQTGFRDRLKEEIESFRSGYEVMVKGSLNPGTQAYTVAFHSVSTSISFLEGLITFVDDIFKELHRAKFSKIKAWALVTRLMRRIFMDVGAPRISVQNQFKTGRDDVICKQIFWAELQALEIMNQFKAHAFKDHPAIASEYGKFLVTNTGIDALDRLIKRVDAFEDQIKELHKSVKAATTAATTASNKVDELKKANTNIVRRLAALERPR
jgi:hypothetical protein